MMCLKKISVLIFLPALLASLLSSQSLVEIAKKEKERRERLKGQRIVSVTNQDLAKLRKKPAVSGTLDETRGETQTEGEGQGEARPSPPVTPQLEGEPYQAGESLTQTVFEEQKRNLEEKWSKAKEYTELLTLKMNALWQNFYAMDTMTSKDSIQQQISETFLKLEAAKEEELKAQEALEEFLANARKEKIPAVWIK